MADEEEKQGTAFRQEGSEGTGNWYVIYKGRSLELLGSEKDDLFNGQGILFDQAKKRRGMPAVEHYRALDPSANNSSENLLSVPVQKAVGERPRANKGREEHSGWLFWGTRVPGRVFYSEQAYEAAAEDLRKKREAHLQEALSSIDATDLAALVLFESGNPHSNYHLLSISNQAKAARDARDLPSLWGFGGGGTWGNASYEGKNGLYGEVCHWVKDFRPKVYKEPSHLMDDGGVVLFVPVQNLFNPHKAYNQIDSTTKEYLVDHAKPAWFTPNR